MTQQGRLAEATHGYTQGYSKYFRQARVRTAFLLASSADPPRHVLLMDAASGSSSQKLCLRQQVIAYRIIV